MKRAVFTRGVGVEPRFIGNEGGRVVFYRGSDTKGRGCHRADLLCGESARPGKTYRKGISQPVWIPSTEEETMLNSRNHLS